MRHPLLTKLGDLRVRRSKASKSADTPDNVMADDRPSALIVTGGSEGIGVALALAFADTADEIVLVARNEAKLINAAGRVASTTKRPVHTLALDLTSGGAETELARFIGEKGLRVHVLINNAGVAYCGDIVDQSVESVDQLTLLNMRIPAVLTQQFLPEMIGRLGSGIVNMSSLGGFYPGPYQTHYYASKAYVNSFSAALSYEVAGYGVRVLAVAPGPVDTRIHLKMGGENALYRYVLPNLSPDRVAADSRRAFAFGQRLVVPGILNRIMATLSGLFPLSMQLPLLALLLKPPRRDHGSD